MKTMSTDRTQLLIIDPQNDFCDLPDNWLPAYSHPGQHPEPVLAPVLPVYGAHQDMLRLAGIDPAQVTKVPLEPETLAAAIIDLGRIYPDTLAQDPFCGSGTLMIEAAMKASQKTGAGVSPKMAMLHRMPAATAR